MLRLRSEQSAHVREPVTTFLPDLRLHEVAHLLLQGLVTAPSPTITQMARGTSHHDETIWLTCKRLYRFLSNERFSHRTLRKGLYHLAQQVVAEQAPEYLVVAVDPVNFEKPYTRHLACPWFTNTRDTAERSGELEIGN